MGGDLNLKKSWHPVLMSNQKKTWEAERAALEERKKIDQLNKERQEERAIEELQQLQEAAGGKKRLNRVDWMYSGPSSGQNGTSEEMEGYLLGKRRVDGLLKGTENQRLEKSAKEDSFMAVQNANSLRDTAAKIREDPLLAIKKQEQAAYEAMMNDPVKRRILLKAAGREDINDSTERERKRRKHHHHHHHRRHRHQHDDEGRSRQQPRRDDEDEHSQARRRPSHRDRSYSPSISCSPPRHRSRRSTSPYHRRNSSSPERRDRSRSPYRPRQDGGQIRKMQSWHSSMRAPQSRSKTPPRKDSLKARDDVAARLAAMQQAASQLDEDREKRLAAIAAKDAADAEREASERQRNAKYGGRAEFINGLNRRAGDMTLGEKMGRSKAGMERESEAIAG